MTGDQSGPVARTPEEALAAIRLVIQDPGCCLWRDGEQGVYLDELQPILDSVQPAQPFEAELVGPQTIDRDPSSQEQSNGSTAERDAFYSGRNTATRRCEWADCPGLPVGLPMHEVEAGPQVHDVCRDAASWRVTHPAPTQVIDRNALRPSPVPDPNSGIDLWTVGDWARWSNSVAELIPEEEFGDVDQETGIRDWVRWKATSSQTLRAEVAESVLDRVRQVHHSAGDQSIPARFRKELDEIAREFGVES